MAEKNDLHVQVTEAQLKELARYRLACVQANPVRSWQVEDKVYCFKKGSNQSKGLYMSSLGAMVRNFFYDKKTQIIYTLEGVLNRRYAYIDDPVFSSLLKYEFDNHIWYSPYYPHSIEYLGKVYQYLIQKFIEPSLEIDTLRGFMRNVFSSTLDSITVGDLRSLDKGGYESREDWAEKKDMEYRAFGHALFDFAQELAEYEPHKARIVEDMSDYSMEEEFSDSERRNAAVRRILGLS